MKQKLLTDIELDVQGLKYLADLYSKEPAQAVAELLKNNILHMQGCLDEMLQELLSVQENSVASVAEAPVVEAETAAVADEIIVVEEPFIVEEPVIAEGPVIEEEPVIVEESLVIEESSVIEEPIVEISAPAEVEMEPEYKPSVLGESIKLTESLRRAISLNDSFRFSRELFGGDVELMNRVLEQLSVMSSYKTALAFLSSKVNLNEENEALNDFLELMKKYFNQPA